MEFSDFYYNQGLQANPMPPAMVPVNKIKLSKNNINLQFYFAGVNNFGYKLSFIVRILIPQMMSSFQQVRASEIDISTLKQAIWDNIDDYDKKYMSLKTFDTNNAEFYFDYNRWIRDSLNGVQLEKQFSVFDRSIRLKAGVPRMILQDSLRSGFVKFITFKMKEYIIKNGLSKKWFYKIVPLSIQNAFNMKTQDLFNYSYDIQYNRFSISLKPELVIAFAYLMKHNIDKKEKIDLSIKDPKYFELAINKNLKKYGKKDWDKVLKKGKYF